MICVLVFSSNLKRFASNTSISGSQTLKTLPEIMTLQDFTDSRTTTDSPVVKINKTKGLLERRGSNASLTIDLGSNSNLADIKPVVPLVRLNTAKSVSNLYMTSQLMTSSAPQKSEQQNCTCNKLERRKIGPETCGNCTIYESVASKAYGCKNKCFHKKCRCLCSLKCRRKSLSNENLYVPAACFETQKHCKGNRKAYYPRQPDLDATQMLSDDFKLHLQNVQYLQTAGRVLTVDDLKSSCEVK